MFRWDESATAPLTVSVRDTIANRGPIGSIAVQLVQLELHGTVAAEGVQLSATVPTRR